MSMLSESPAELRLNTDKRASVRPPNTAVGRLRLAYFFFVLASTLRGNSGKLDAQCEVTTWMVTSHLKFGHRSMAWECPGRPWAVYNTSWVPCRGL